MERKIGIAVFFLVSGIACFLYHPASGQNLVAFGGVVIVLSVVRIVYVLVADARTKR